MSDFIVNFVIGFMGGLFAVVIYSFWDKQDEQKQLLVHRGENSPIFIGDPVEFIESTPPEVEAMEAVFKQNEAKGEDTKISEL